MKSLHYRALAFVAALVAAAVVLVPTFASSLPDWWPCQEPVRLGLDLRGGTHLLYEVAVEKAIDQSAEQARRDVEHGLRDGGIGVRGIGTVGRSIEVRLDAADSRSGARRIIEAAMPNLTIAEGSTPQEADFTLVFTSQELRRLRDGVVDQSLETIRNRVDQFGVAEATIQRQGGEEIVIQLPGIQDPQRAKSLIGKTAVLEFRLTANGGKSGTEDLPAASRLPGEPARYVLEKKVLMTGAAVADARVRPGTQLEGPYVELILSGRGALEFEQITTDNVGRNLAIVLDGKVFSAPVIREKIGGGRASISGNFDVKEARDLAIVLRAGALPAPLELLEERTVGPSLGMDSIRKGTLSFIVGSLAVFAFMAAYYRGGGVIADAALIANVLLVLGAFAAFGFTLTLPGIAGIVLTVGMAVDANILILERVREELRIGRSVRSAIEAGYDRAWSAILDSNVTVLIAGIILFQFGSGPVRGFAVTLCLGIFTSLMTAVFGTRIVYDWLLTSRRAATVSV
jgi:preprotein translocase subunit SecD